MSAAEREAAGVMLPSEEREWRAARERPLAQVRPLADRCGACGHPLTETDLLRMDRDGGRVMHNHCHHRHQGLVAYLRDCGGLN